MSELTFEQMENILLAHEKAELEMDIEATMATVSPNGRWEFPSDGLVAIGLDAIREHYRRMLPGAQQWNIAAEKRVHAGGPNSLVREAWVSWNTPEGSRLKGLYLVVMTFDPETELISAERLYTDANYAKFMERQLDVETYKEFPGVQTIESVAPVIDTHDAFEMAELRGMTIDGKYGRE
ncbi:MULTISPECIES: nuclear transport factor 2 family protein [unclassified Nocardia]|uniref:nuclear transport factor 2 family protein n=1 Tax=unclassified Nocardia TaxID=2637762 RepID=UPI00339F632E